VLVVVLVRAGSKGQISLRRKGSGSSLRKISSRPDSRAFFSKIPNYTLRFACQEPERLTMSRRFPSTFVPPLSPTLCLHLRCRAQLVSPRRHASTSNSYPRRFLSTTLFLGTGAILVAYYYDSRSILHEHVAMPLIRFLADPETGHRFAIRLLGLSRWARPRDMGVDGEELGTEVSDFSSLSFSWEAYEDRYSA